MKRIFAFGEAPSKAPLAKKLTEVETRAVVDAHDLLANGWPGHDEPLTDKLQVQRQALIQQCLADFASGNPRSQRVALQSLKFKDLVQEETQRREKLRQLDYFSSVPEVSMRSALQIIREDQDTFASPATLFETAEGRQSRQSLFPDIDSDAMRLEMAKFCGTVAAEVSREVQKLSQMVEETSIRVAIQSAYHEELANLDEQRAQQRVDAIEKLANAGLTKPERFVGYLALFRRNSWQPGLMEAVIQLRQVKHANAGAAERQKVARQRDAIIAASGAIARQLAFKVEDKILDVSLHGWPVLAGENDQVALLDNLKAAFAKATTLRLGHLSAQGDQFIVHRHIRSMSSRQFSLVKRQLWADRQGMLYDMREFNGDLKLVGSRLMIDLLNADGKASILSRNGRHGQFTSELADITSKWRVDVNQEWWTYADTFQHWISSNAIGGEWARWIMEEPNRSAGWAESR